MEKMDEIYESPTLSVVGTVHELTKIDKCGGSGDAVLPLILSPTFGTPHCP